MAHDPYTTGTTTIDYYSLSSGSTEPSMRQEFINFLDGKWPEIAKRQKGLLRKPRRNSTTNKIIPCPCVNNLTHEADKDIFCAHCFSSGYFWDEEYVWFYKTLEEADTSNTQADYLSTPGLINGKLVVFYIRYNADISKEDRVIEIALDTSGTPEVPLTRTGVYRISRVWDYRSDNGRLEYYKVFTYQENVKYLNTPTSGII